MRRLLPRQRGEGNKQGSGSAVERRSVSTRRKSQGPARMTRRVIADCLRRDHVSSSVFFSFAEVMSGEAVPAAGEPVLWGGGTSVQVFFSENGNAAPPPYQARRRNPDGFQADPH